jgi:hypothetical protein
MEINRRIIAIHLPDDFDPSLQDKSMERDIDALNEEMLARNNFW